MEYRNLGRTGIKVSPLALGGWNLGEAVAEDGSIRMIHQALEAGINLIDTADEYGAGDSERIIGKALAGGKRQHVILATKFHFPTSPDVNDRGNSRRHIFQSVEASLKRLQTDWIDLYQAHRPVFDTPQEETLRALDDLVHQGKVLYIGCSTFPAWMVMEALAISDRFGLSRYVTEQPPYNLLDRRIENELVPLALRYGFGLLAWSPLASGVLAGRYGQADQAPSGSRAERIGGYAAERVTAKGIDVARQTAEIARRAGISPSQLALAWVKDQPGVTSVLLGSRSQSQLTDALGTLDLHLSEEVRRKLDELVPPGSAVADFHNTSTWMKMRI